jgi:hypothetical protein
MSKKETAPAPSVPAVQPTSLPATEVSSFESMAGEGLDNVTARDLLVPRITLLQSLSPQLNAQKPNFIKDAKVGDICDVAMEELFAAPLIVVPVHYVKQWLEWKPKRAGLAAIHNDESILEKCTKDDKGKQFLPNGNVVIETAQFFVLNLNALGRRSFIPLASSQLKNARKWLTKATDIKLPRKSGEGTYTPPFFYMSYALSVVNESNAEGDWAGWKVEVHKPIGELEGSADIFDEAVKFREQVVSGFAKADLSSLGEETSSGDHTQEQM